MSWRIFVGGGVAKVYQIIVETYWSEFFVSSKTNNVLLLDVFK